MKIINFRTTIAGAAIAAILTSGAAATDVMPINQADESAIMLINSDVNLYVNGLASSVNAKEFDGKMMLPLRGLCEAQHHSFSVQLPFLKTAQHMFP